LNVITLIVNDSTIKKIIAANEATGKKSEWIGILFYKKIDNKTLETVDICYMGKGPENSMVANIDYTEFPELSSVLSNYVMNNAEKLIDCYQGLIHSHIDMATNPSGTDLSELMANNSNYNGTYLSVICNHRLEFTTLLSLEEEQPKNITNYKWFGEIFTRETETKKNINIYVIKTQFNNTEYPDITEALAVVEKARTFKMKANSQTSLWNDKSWNTKSWNLEKETVSYLDELNDYFGFDKIKTTYAERIKLLNDYSKKGFSIDAFIEAIDPFNANEVLRELNRFSHTQFYKDLKSYIDIFKLSYNEL
jgi:hypothetical protein